VLLESITSSCEPGEIQELACLELSPAPSPLRKPRLPAPYEITSSSAQQLSLAVLVLQLIEGYFLTTHLIFVFHYDCYLLLLVAATATVPDTAFFPG